MFHNLSVSHYVPLCSCICVYVCVCMYMTFVFRYVFLRHPHSIFNHTTCLPYICVLICVSPPTFFSTTPCAFLIHASLYIVIYVSPYAFHRHRVHSPFIFWAPTMRVPRHELTFPWRFHSSLDFRTNTHIPDALTCILRSELILFFPLHLPSVHPLCRPQL